MATIELSPDRIEDYRLFLAIKRLPRFRFQGRTAIVPDEYVDRLGLAPATQASLDYRPIPGLFDYQRDIAALAVRKRKFAVFMACGLGKTLVMTEFARHALAASCRRVLIVSPLMVADQTIAEARRFYGDVLPIEKVDAAGLQAWLDGPGAAVGITNYEAIRDGLAPGNLGGLILDESSMLKSAYGKWGARLIDLGKGLSWKLALTGTPAPNDRIEYANHAVFLDAFPTTNSFLARFFVNRGQTDNRWELKPHALRPFYTALSDWCVFVNDPGTYGWKDNAGGMPPIRVHIHDVDLTEDQLSKITALTGSLFGVADPGGIVGRSKLARIAKSGDSLKPAFVRSLIGSWPAESTLVWCRFNDEQDGMAEALPGSASIAGDTPMAERARIIAAFQAGEVRTLISKPKVLGFGLNLQVATRQVFSSLHDSYEEFHQAVKRSNRVGSTVPLNVHIPVTDAERPMVETVLRKARRVEQDTAEQEAIFNAAR